MSDEPTLADQARSFIGEHRTAILATADSEGEPLASYAPFLFFKDAFYIFVSQLAGHTRNLINSPSCHLMLIRDEQASVNLFARQRLSFACAAVAIDRQSVEFSTCMHAMREQFGPVIGTLASLPDFILFRLEPGDGNFVTGFGKAVSLRLS